MVESFSDYLTKSAQKQRKILDSFVQAKMDLGIKAQPSIELFLNLWFKEGILQSITGLEENQFMETSLLIKTLLKNMISLLSYRWQMLVQIRMDHSFLSPLL
jgi:hypothetical protein